MKIVILDDYQNVVKKLECFSLLSEHDVTVLTQSFKNTDDLAEKIKDAEAIVLIRERSKIDAKLLSKLPHLKLISQTGKIGNHIDISACNESRVLVAEGKGSPVAPAELCWALIMAASRNLPSYCANLLDNKWQNSGNLGLGRTLSGLSLGIWGYGKIGQRIAQYAKAFGMNVVIWGSESSCLRAQKDGFSVSNSKVEFFSSCDILSLHLRLNDETRNCVKRADLALMKSNSLFVNISRAELVEENALYNELKQNPSKRAAIDVFNTEPATLDNEPLLSLENVICTPHIGYVEKNSYELYFKKAFENIVAFTQNK